MGPGKARVVSLDAVVREGQNVLAQMRGERVCRLQHDRPSIRAGRPCPECGAAV